MLWLIILMIALAILPDLLRRRKRPRKGPIPLPPRRKPLETKAEPENPAAGTKETPAEPLPAAQPIMPKAQVPEIQTPKKKVSLKAPRRVHSAPWSSLTPQARELYTGFIWSEIWQAPLAKRRKIR